MIKSEDKKPAKVPWLLSGAGPAKTNDPATWGAYQERAPDGCDGIGFVFSAEDAFVGIDFDGCLDGWGVVAPWARTWIDRLGTYAEISPSGTGVKCYGVGVMPDGKGRNRKLKGDEGIEAYDRLRYFAFTGRHLAGTPTGPQPCQEALDALLAHFWPASPPVLVPARTGAIPGTSPPDLLDRARAYLAEVDPAVAGCGGHNITFRAACALVIGFGLSPEEAMPLMENEYNPRCEPPWSERELWHKLQSADQQEGERGYLVEQWAPVLDVGPPVDLSWILGIEAGRIDDREPDPEPGEPAPEFPRECLEKLPRMLRLAYEYAMESAIKPQPVLTLAALLPLFGAVFGRRVMDDYGTRSNLMVLGLAPSGSGKEHPRKCNKQILYHADLMQLNGPERVGSHAGIISSVDAHPVRFFQLDEIGRLLATMRDPKSNPHLYNVGTVLMQLYSSSDTTWTGDAYADLKKVKQVHQPCVCVYGTSVAESFYAALSPSNISDGLIGRLLVFEEPDYGKRRKPCVGIVPWELTEAIKAWQQIGSGGNLWMANPDPMLIPKTEEASQLHEEYCELVHRRHAAEDANHAAVWARAPEKEAKLALIHACCCAVDPGKAVITAESVLWAKRLVNYATRLVLYAAACTIASGRYEESKKKVWRCITDGMTKRELSRRTQWLRQRERDEILADLVDSEALAIDRIDTGSKPKTILRKLRSAP